MLEVLILRVVAEVVIEAGIIDSVYVDMLVGLGKQLPEKGVMPLGIGGMGRIEILRLVTGFRDGQSLSDPINGGVCGVEPGES